ncbi:acyltransferase family protein [Fontivita pretiosa]|uniref:acyltransferase family protein n=1 Tax=Fontivita pretiosa TaxID=2989684 RepID=UPI003D16E446
MTDQLQSSRLLTDSGDGQPDSPSPAVAPPLRLPSHIPALDGIRGIAVLLVLFCHATQRPFGESANQAFSSLVDRGILSLARLSWTGVDLFFVLSGFLITGILYDAKNKPHYFRNFYARRTVRIFPLYYACLVLFLLVWPMLPAGFSRGFGELQTGPLPYWLYISNYSQGLTENLGRTTDHILHVTWSLSIEEQFYLCWPLVVFLCTRQTLLRICVYMFFGAMALRTALLLDGFWNVAMMFTPCRVDGLAVGAAIALIARGPRGIGCLIRPAKIIGPASAIALGILIVGMYKLGYRRGIGQSPGYVTLGNGLISIFYGSILIFAAASDRGTWANRFFASRPLRTFGKYSYAVYLLHMPIMILFAEYVFSPAHVRLGGSLLPGLLIYYAATWTLSLLAALASWNLLEKHFLKLKDYFPMEPRAQATHAALQRESTSAKAAA